MYNNLLAQYMGKSASSFWASTRFCSGSGNMFGLLSLPQHPARDLRLEISGNVWGTVLASVSPSVKWDSQSTPNPALGF